LSKKRRKLQIIGAFFPEIGTKEDAKKGLLPYSKKEEAIHTIPNFDYLPTNGKPG